MLIDADTGFGEPLNVARTIRTLEHAGLAGCHIEDQVNPKRCGHLDNKQVVGRRGDGQAPPRRGGGPPGSELRDLRTHRCARGRGLGRRDRARQAYVDAGADMIFPEALPTNASSRRSAPQSTCRCWRT